MKKPRKRPMTASDMAKKRWAGTTKEQRVAYAMMMVRARQPKPSEETTEQK